MKTEEKIARKLYTFNPYIKNFLTGEFEDWDEIGLGQHSFIEQAKVLMLLFPKGLWKLLEEMRCPECNGEGTREYYYHCPTCKGTGNRYEIALIDTKAELGRNVELEGGTFDGLDRGYYEYIKANFHKVVKRL